MHSVFTTLLVLQGKPVFLSTHVARLAYHSTVLGCHDVQQDIEATLMRVMPFDEGKEMAVKISINAKRKISVVVRKVPERIVVQAHLTEWSSNLLFASSIKHSDRGLWEKQKQILQTEELLWFTEKSGVLEFSNGNLFVYRNGKLYTPPLNGQILPGVMRSAVMTLAKKHQMEVVELPIYLQPGDLLYMTSSLRGMVPVMLGVIPADNPLGDFCTRLWCCLADPDFQHRVHQQFISQSWK